MAKIDVVAIALFHKKMKKYLIVRRSPGQSGAGVWEFPGGKIEIGETPTKALVREIKEELDHDVHEHELHFVAENTHAYPQKTIRLLLFKAMTLQSHFTLIEHDQQAWVDQSEIHDYQLSEADQPFLLKLF